MPCELLRHRFRDRELYCQALTHSSAGSPHNQRLEYLGDSLLGFLIAEHLFRRFPSSREGELTRMRAHLVRGGALARLALAHGLERRIRLGKSIAARPPLPESVLASLVEAIVGAIYMDGGLARCRRAVRFLYGKELESFVPSRARKSSKTRLNEFLQAQGWALPIYRVLGKDSCLAEENFIIQCQVFAAGNGAADSGGRGGMELSCQGSGPSKRRAEEEAAGKVLARLQGQS